MEGECDPRAERRLLRLARRQHETVTPHAIISYDDTPGDHDALALGRLFAGAGAQLTLAYVRHAAYPEHDRELLAEHGAEILLECGARRLDDPDVERRVVLSACTPEGLGWLAQHEQADMIVFGSDYRTPAGHISIGRSTQPLLEHGHAAVAIAPAAYSAQPGPRVEAIGILSGSADEAAIETAFSLAGRLGATVVDADRGVGLLVVGSRPEAPEGQVTISSRSHNAIEEARSPVIVVARGVPVRFDSLVFTA
jgi:nucleotide-binding universal stress UspA family protein